MPDVIFRNLSHVIHLSAVKILTGGLIREVRCAFGRRNKPPRTTAGRIDVKALRKGRGVSDGAAHLVLDIFPAIRFYLTDSVYGGGAMKKDKKKTVTWWKCSSCGYTLQDATPPETCPGCRQTCSFTDVTCYTPECGGTGAIDPRLMDREKK